ncbi:23S rRNA (adenine(2030)-N(6))-methyltransferase RlmJ [Lichenihabitans sp. Uapishka_5]|uniref:23S rRNA (adenine(2030)-N(6))-methyltransferase RlmJ n=1 Tax=Lichenihabitans sp. Uapishka_5 TaxID=3037302 RepID=UPI0029E8172C|nr:23S rRNA (adenine(2030)-N(6))-methyltransferase RlmJ [Lichenihabitans sp. Uapishka_5]MDX7952457.1 23S rRNA (adenine(2030)-N(6))-methyltransferase RlmJ [Lichenihabitans sp. Uapishka_5]
MNYRHAFHAGNFADVVKHLLLSRILVYLGRKPAPFRYIDTHAGIGRYDLGGPEASRTGEWQGGIGRLLRVPPPLSLRDLLDPYLKAVGPAGPDGHPLDYPGSPVLAQRLLRRDDRMLLAELHPEDAATLRSTLGRDKRLKVVERDGYQVLAAALPPPERRGVVLIDPPFEERDEFPRLVAALKSACRKWATGTYVIWHPIKDDAAVSAFHHALSEAALPPSCRIDLFRDETSADPGLRGSGLLVINPPYVLAEEAGLLLPFLCSTLGDPAETPFRWTLYNRDT